MAKEGRPSKMTPETVNKLEEVFAIDGTVEEACFYANISRVTYYEWIKENPKLANRFEALRERPVLKARQAVVKGLDNFDNGMRYLERKKKLEFSLRTELTGKDGEALIPSQEAREKAVKVIDEFLNNNLDDTGNTPRK